VQEVIVYLPGIKTAGESIYKLTSYIMLYINLRKDVLFSTM